MNVAIGTYEQLCRRSAEFHLAHTERELPSIRGASPRQLARALIATTKNALADGAALSGDKVTLRLGLVRAAMSSNSNETSQLLNQCSLGLGAVNPDVLFIGKEAAFDPKQAHANFLLESLALTILWLCSASDEVMRQLLEDQNLVGTSFLQHPWAVNVGTYQQRRPSDHTWNVINRVLDRAGLGSWSESGYLVELGVIPSKKHAGQEPTAERIAFLSELACVLARSRTRTLVFHGREPGHAAAQGRIAAAFLAEDRPLATCRSTALSTAAIEVWEANERRVVRCRHLSNLFGDESVVRDVADRLLK